MMKKLIGFSLALAVGLFGGSLLAIAGDRDRSIDCAGAAVVTEAIGGRTPFESRVDALVGAVNESGGETDGEDRSYAVVPDSQLGHVGVVSQNGHTVALYTFLELEDGSFGINASKYCVDDNEQPLADFDNPVFKSLFERVDDVDFFGPESGFGDEIGNPVEGENRG